MSKMLLAQLEHIFQDTITILRYRDYVDGCDVLFLHPQYDCFYMFKYQWLFFQTVSSVSMSVTSKQTENTRFKKNVKFYLNI